jgi:hypothetical protein
MLDDTFYNRRDEETVMQDDPKVASGFTDLKIIAQLDGDPFPTSPIIPFGMINTRPPGVGKSRGQLVDTAEAILQRRWDGS